MRQGRSFQGIIMARLKIDWHTKEANHLNKDIVLDRFSRYLRSCGFHSSTIDLYLSRLNAFLEYANCEEPTIEKANEFREVLIDRGISKSHINNTCFAIKRYFKLNNIEWNFIILRGDERVPYYFDENDVLAIFSACTNLKHLAILKTLFYGCLRSSELCRLEDSDLDLKAKTIRLRHTKNGHDSITMINEDCAEILRRYLRIRPQKEIDGKIPLFYTDHLHLWSKEDIHRMFMDYKKKAGIKKPGAVHVFSRHTTATMMIANGADLRIVQEILRHRDIRTTLRYAHVSDKTKRERYEQCLTL
jgi:integrase/recombinase XerD